MKKVINFFINGYRCFKHYKKWRQATAIDKSGEIFYFQLNDPEMACKLWNVSDRLYKEIHMVKNESQSNSEQTA